jgi:hypothetical protein
VQRPGADPAGALAAERASADHWRTVAQQRTEALTALRRRPLVRAALALDRRAEPVRRVVRRAAAVSHHVRRAGVAVAAAPTLRRRRSREDRLDAELARLAPPPGGARTTSVVVVGGRPPGPVPEPGLPTEVVVVETGNGRTTAGAVAAAVDRVGGELLCLVLGGTAPLVDSWLARLAEPLGTGAVAAVPTVVHPRRPPPTATPHDLLVRHTGLVLELGPGEVPFVSARGAGDPVDVGAAPAEVTAGSAAALLVERSAYDAVGGLAPLDDLDAAVVDLCARLGREQGPVLHVPSAVVADGRPVDSLARLTVPVDAGGTGWRAVLDRQGPALRRAVSPGPESGLRVALTVASPSAKVAELWGDWHLAGALGAALERRGHRVLRHPADQADGPAARCCDVHVVLRGLAPVRRTPGQRHVLWVISHPEAVADAECDEADLVLVASARFAEALRGRTATPVEVLLQATDHHRFRPVEPDPRYRHPVTVVAKTREVLRSGVADALSAGIRPAIYGGGWDGLVDESLIRARHVPNEQLPTVYSSAGVVLNDHWSTMRAWGFVSNRVFDVLACGTPVVSDHLPELVELFGDAVPTYRTPEELRALVTAALDDPEAARARAERGRQQVLAAHTFDHRAAQLLDLLGRHGLGAPPC